MMRSALRDAGAGMMDPMEMDEFAAALAVIGSLREVDAVALRRALDSEIDAQLASRITDAMHGAGSMRVRTFWSASGQAAIDTTVLRCAVSESAASLMVGAALHALVLAKSDVTQQAVMDLAERAFAWHRGRLFGAGTRAHA